MELPFENDDCGYGAENADADATQYDGQGTYHHQQTNDALRLYDLERDDGNEVLLLEILNDGALGLSIHSCAACFQQS